MTGDLSITQFASKFRHTAAAVLVQIAMDESQPAQARIAASERILAYSDGRPTASKATTLADLELMSPEQRQDLLHALLTKYDTEFPGAFQAQVEDAYVSALQRVQSGRPIRYKRGAPLPKPPHEPQHAVSAQKPTPQSILNNPPDAARTVNGGPRYAGSEDTLYPAATAVRAAGGATTEIEGLGQSSTENGIDNSTAERSALDSRADRRVRNVPKSSDNVIPLPFGLKYGLEDTIAPTQANTPPAPTPVNGIHPDVVRRSAKPPSMAMDLAFQGYRRW